MKPLFHGAAPSVPLPCAAPAIDPDDRARDVVVTARALAGSGRRGLSGGSCCINSYGNVYAEIGVSGTCYDTSGSADFVGANGAIGPDGFGTTPLNAYVTIVLEANRFVLMASIADRIVSPLDSANRFGATGKQHGGAVSHGLYAGQPRKLFGGIKTRF